MIHSTKHGIIDFAHDFIVCERKQEEYDDTLKQLMNAAQQNGLMFRVEKRKIACPEVNLLDHSSWDDIRMTGLHPEKCDKVIQ